MYDEVSMARVLALTVVGEHFDDAAGRDATVTASLDHRLQFCLERAQAADPLLDIRKARLGDAVGRRARLVRVVLKEQQGSDRFDLESQLAGVSDECEATQVARVVVTSVAVAARRRGQKTDLFVIADGRDFDAAAFGGFPDRNPQDHFACSSSH